MSTNQWNKIQTPTNPDSFTNLTTDLGTLAAKSNVVVYVSSQAERDALAPPGGKYAGMVVARTDLPGVPLEQYDGTNWSTWQAPKVWNGGNVGVGSGSGMLANLQSGAVIPIIQAESVVVTPNSFGHATITFPQAFPNGLMCVLAVNGDTAATGAAYNVNIGTTGATVTNFMASIQAGTTAWTASCRINYIAIGW